MKSPPSPGESRRARLRTVVVATSLLLCTVLLASIWATQYAAARFHYHPALGNPWYAHFYAPWAWLIWQWRYYDSNRSLFNLEYIISLLAFGAAFLLFALYYGFTARAAKVHEGVHGTAHFASETEVKGTGLLQSAGVYVGGWADGDGALHYLRHDGPEHVLAVAPTRSGKGVGLVVPTLLSCPASTIVHDIKGELWNLTAGWRKKHAANYVLKFDPASAEGSVHFNPLAEIRLATQHEVADTQNIASLIVDPDGKGLNDHWQKTAHALLTGVILHAAYKARSNGSQATLPKVAGALSDPSRPAEELYEEMLGNTHCDGEAHPVVAATGRDMLNTPDKERGSILSTAKSFLSLYRDPIVAQNTSSSDFRIDDLMDADRPASLYLVVGPADKDRLRPLVRLVSSQAVRGLVRPQIQFKDGRPLPVHKHRMLLMLDEFPSLGKLDIVAESLAYVAGYGIKAFLVAQDVSQLWNAYGKDETIIGNCHIRVAYAPTKVETAEWLSKMTGQATVIKEDVSNSGKRFGALLEQVSRTMHEVQRPLMTADECMRLRSPRKNAKGEIEDAGDMLIFIAGHPPIRGSQILYFRDPVFSERARIPPPSTDRIASESAVRLPSFEVS